MAEKVLPPPAAIRYANQVLALHQALGLLRVFDLDPTHRPSAVKEAIRILDDATEPLRPVPRTRQTNKALTSPPTAPSTPPPAPVPAPKKTKKVTTGTPEHEARIKRRLDVGMTREMAEAHIDSGSSIGPDGEDLDALLGIDIPTVDVASLSS